MDRSWLRQGSLVVALTLIAATPFVSVGCRTVLTTAAYLIKGTNVDAEYDGLKEKRVVVVCRPVADLTFRSPTVDRDLAKEVGRLLQQNVKKIRVVPQQEVSEWTDEHLWTDYLEVGEALGADMVVGIDLYDFSLLLDQTLYQGRASTAVRVFDCKTGGDPVFEREVPQIAYPPNVGIPTSERSSESSFEREFVRVLADHVGRYFYPHDPYADYAMDARAMENR
jgi:hypothetical protein